MTGRRHGPALVIVALVSAAALGVWLLGEGEAGRGGGRAGRGPAPREAPRVDLEPGASPAAKADAVERARGTGGVGGADGERPGDPAQAPGAERREVDPPPAIRGVRGLVREAATGRPIAGAWVTWRYPHPRACEAVFASGSLLVEGTGEMVTDAEGRFDVQRLPDDLGVASTLFAVAPGFGVAALRPGLREDVVFDLERGGTLEVRLRGPERLGHQQSRPGTTWGTGPVSIERADDPAGAVNLGEFPGQHDDRWVYRAPNLARGDYRVRVLGRDVGVSTIEPGATWIVEATHPADVEVTGTLAGREDDDAEVILRALDGVAIHSLGVDGAGRLSGMASEGHFSAALYNANGSERPLGEVEVRAGGPPLRLEAPPAGDQVEVMLRGAREAARVLGLAALEQGEQGDLVALAPDPARPDVHVGRARPGGHALLDGPTLLTTLTLPARGPLVVDATPFVGVVRFELPRALRPEEVVRGRVALVPEVLARLPRLRAEVVANWAHTLRLSHASPRLEVELVVPGRYLLVGETDLGPFEAWVDLAPGAERVVPVPD
ncbi:MAG: hypothetical protein M9894_20210 [Planctomycetes bacterium]|nr:hypothetical protein [Planctomycetota bacterium]